MPKSTYQVSHGENERKSSSYRSFICALLVFLVICLVLFAILHLTTVKILQMPKSGHEHQKDKEIVEKGPLNEKLIVVNAEDDFNFTTLKPLKLLSTSRSTTIPENGEESQEKDTNDIDEYDHDVSEENVKIFTERATSEAPENSKLTTTDILQTVNLINTGISEQITTDNVLKTENRPFTDNIIEVGATTETLNNENTNTYSTTDQNQLHASTKGKFSSFTYNTSTVEELTTAESISTDLHSPETTTNILSTVPVISSVQNQTVISTSSSQLTTTNIPSPTTTNIPSTVHSTPSSFPTVLTTLFTTTKYIPIKTVRRKQQNQLTRSNHTCKLITCKSTASRMLSLMNHSVDACLDFYEFACNSETVKNYAQNAYQNEDNINHMLIEYIHKISATNVTQKEFLQILYEFYTSCTKYEQFFDYPNRVERLLTYFRNIIQNEAYLIMLQSIPFINVGLGVDEKTSTFILQLTLNDDSLMQSFLPNWSILTKMKQICLEKQKTRINENDLNILYDKYKQCVKDEFTTYVERMKNYLQNYITNSSSSSDPMFAPINIKNALYLVELINTIIPQEGVLRRAIVNREYTHMTVKQLQNLCPIWNWTQTLSEITDSPIIENNPLRVFLLDDFVTLCNKLNARFTQGGLFHALKFLAFIQLYENTIIPIAEDHRENYCLKLSRQLMPDIFTYIYKTTHSQHSLTQKHLEMVSLFDTLRSRFVESLNQSTWMTEPSNSILAQRVLNSKLSLIESGDTIQFANNLNFIYLNYSPSGDFQIDLLELIKFYKMTVLKMYGNAALESYLQTYFVDPYSVSPRSFHESKFIFVPGGIFDIVPNHLPDYILMARVGYELAIEIVRKLDLSTVRLLENIGPEIYQSFESMANDTTSLLNDGSPYYFKGKVAALTENNDGTSINELVMENAALRILEDLMTNVENEVNLPWISEQYPKNAQVFYIALAQEFCTKSDWPEFMLSTFESEQLPATLRIRNIMSNSHKFPEEFQCSQGGVGLNFRPDAKFQFPYILDSMDYDNITSIT